MITDREERLMKSLIDFFNCKVENGEEMPHIIVMKNIIEGNGISLRILDWFVTNYAKKYHIVYPIMNKTTTIDAATGNKTSKASMHRFDVWTEYKSQLKLFSKEAFDPFCRMREPDKTELLRFYYDKSGTLEFIETTIGQLNFFRWIISNNILDYVYKHLDVIEQDMLRVHHQLAMNKKKKRSRSLSASTNIRVGVVPREAHPQTLPISTKKNSNSNKRHKITISVAKTFVQNNKVVVSFD